MVSDVLEESSDIVRQVFSDVVFIFDELLGSTFFGSIFIFATLFLMLRFIFSIVGDVSFGSDSSEECVRCEFLKDGHCPYSLKNYDEDWCKKFCQVNFKED